MELPILRELARRQHSGLINDLWIRTQGCLELIMPLVDQRGSAVFEPILIGSVGPDGNQNDRMVSAKAEIHSTLEADAFAPTHFIVGKNVI
jgi:hypothetical protein